MTVPGFAALDFHAFHRGTLPGLLSDGRGASAARFAAKLGGLALRLPDGSAYSYLPRHEAVEVIAGDADAATVIELDADSWQGLVHDYESVPGLLYGSRARCARGNALRFVHWEPALRRLYTGREIYDASAIDLRDRHGVPLDATQAFALGDLGQRADDMSHFLRTAGYLVVRGVFSRAETGAFLAEARALAEEARPGDKLSWWAKDAAGHELLCRVTRAASRPRLASLPGDERVLFLAGLARTPLVHRDGEGNGVSVIFKNPGVKEGLSDLPWHRDCGMGGHALLCPVLIVSVYLTPATPDTGELRFLPGSWDRACGFVDANDPRAPRGVSVAAEPGDVTLHFGDVMHAAPPPARHDLEAYRISAITGFAPPSARVHRGKSYNEALHRRDDGQIEHLTQIASRGTDGSRAG